MPPIQVLCVAEKPSVCKEVSSLLNGRLPQARPGLSQYNYVYDFPFTLRNTPCNVHFTSVRGHLTEVDFPDTHRTWHSCSPVELFRAPLVKRVAPDSEAIARTLEREARSCQWLILWLDCDREGEHIAHEVMDVCLKANPRMQVFRARFSAVIDREIRHALAHLVEPNKNEADAVDARIEIDLRIGSAFTRWQTLTLQNVFDMSEFNREEDKGPMLSYGPCQFPTLGFIVERHWEIQQHVPEDFWTIDVRHEERVVEGGPGAQARFSWGRQRLYDHEGALILFEMCVQEPEATVTKVQGRKALKHPPNPLNTIEMQKRGSRFLRMGAEQTLKVAEELYQEGFISYPRTETDIFVEGTDLLEKIAMHSDSPQWGTYAQGLLHNDLYQTISLRQPTAMVRRAGGRVGGGVTTRHIRQSIQRGGPLSSCCSRAAVGSETTIDIDIAGESFRAKGLMVIEKNWLEVYHPWEQWSGNANLPKLEEGSRFIPTEMNLNQSQTSPPAYLQESDLLTLMDRHGIGTDATMGEHIAKQFNRQYALKDGQYLKPTKLGEALVAAYAHMEMANMWRPMLRGTMERKMTEVARGQTTKQEFLQMALVALEQEFRNATSKQAAMFETIGRFFTGFPGGANPNQRGAGGGGIQGPPVQTCTRRCTGGGRMYLKQTAAGKWMCSCNNFPACRNSLWLPMCVEEAAVVDEATRPAASTCEHCSRASGAPVRRVVLRIRRSSMPLHLRHLVEPAGPGNALGELEGCLAGCDADMNNLVDLGSNGGGGGGGGGRGGGRGQGGRGGRGRGQGGAAAGTRGRGNMQWGRGNVGYGRGQQDARGGMGHR